MIRNKAVRKEHRRGNKNLRKEWKDWLFNVKNLNDKEIDNFLDKNNKQ